MKRVLVLAYLFPPIANSGSQRPLKFVKYLSRFGWEPIVMTAANFGDHRIDEGLLADIPDGTSVVRVPMLNERIAGAIATIGLGTTLARRLADGVSWRLKTRFRRPDLYSLWRPLARRAAMKVFHDRGFDAIYATGFPWTSLLIGRDVSKATGRPLIADFRDPWAAEDLFRAEHPSGDAELALEQSIVRHAASVVTVSTTMTARMIAAHPEVDAEKFVTIHNGFDPEDINGAAPPPHQRFRIVYTGVWKEGYNPAALYDAIDRIRRSTPDVLTDVEVIAAGFEPGEARRRDLAGFITEVGVLSHEDAVALMHSADLLFLSNGDGARQQLGLPGKMYEYLATGRPVLAFTDPSGDAGRIIQQVGGGITVPTENPGLLVEVIAAACRNKKLDTPPPNRSVLAAFERPNLTQKLAELLEQATNRTPIPAGSPRSSSPEPAVLRLRPR